jgi:AcrR family transcriptional regulator
VGSLYQYFPNKDSLLASLLEQHHDDVRRVVGAALKRLADPATPLEDGLRWLVQALMQVHQDNPMVTRALSEEVLRESPAAEEPHRHDQGVAQNRRVMALLAARPDVREGDHAAMAAVLVQATGTLTRWLVHDLPAELDRGTLQEEMVQLLSRYLVR